MAAPMEWPKIEDTWERETLPDIWPDRGRVAAMFCPATGEPPIIDLLATFNGNNVFRQAKKRLGRLHPECRDWGIDTKYEFRVKDDEGWFSITAVYARDEAESGLPVNEFVTKMMKFKLGPNMFHGPCYWIATKQIRDEDGDEIDVPIDIISDRIGPLQKLLDDWAKGHAQTVERLRLGLQTTKRSDVFWSF